MLLGAHYTVSIFQKSKRCTSQNMSKKTRQDEIKVRLLWHIWSNSWVRVHLPPATTNLDAPSDVARHGRRTSPGRHPSQSRPTPARPRPLKSRPAPAGAGGRSASFSRESRPRRHAPRAENTPSLRPGRGTSNPSLPADLCLSDREMRTPPAPRMFLRGRCLARRFCSKLLLKSRYRK